MPHGRQDLSDITSCGICASNADAHDVLGDVLYTHATRNLLRIQYFLNLVEAHNEHVSTAI